MSRTSPQPLEVPRILRIKQGRTGELIIFHTPLGREAKAYDVDSKPQDEPDTPEGESSDQGDEEPEDLDEDE